jgi:hypothetical protein
LASGGTVTASRNAESILTLDINSTQTMHSNQPVTLHFEGAYKTTDNGGGNPNPDPNFVPVERLAIASTTHALSIQQADVNSVHSLSEVVVYPANATNKTIEWTMENATRSDDGSSIIFDKEGVATVTATIRNGQSSGDFRVVWRVNVGYDPEKVITFNGANRPIRSTDYSVDQWANGLYGHKMKFFINGPDGVSIEFATTSETLAVGDYLSTGGGMPADGQALVFLDFATNANNEYDYLAASAKVFVDRYDDGTFRVAIKSTATVYSGLPLEMLYVGEIEKE